MSLSRKRRNVLRRQKREILKQLHVPYEDREQVVDWGWNRIYEKYAPVDRPDVLPYPVDIPSRERYKKNRELLREAGYKAKEIERLQYAPPEVIQFAIITEPLRPVPREWEYEPFDKNYTTDYAYLIEYSIIDPQTDDIISTSFMTIISNREMSMAEIIEAYYSFLKDAERYPLSYSILTKDNVKPMSIGTTPDMIPERLKFT